LFTAFVVVCFMLCMVLFYCFGSGLFYALHSVVLLLWQWLCLLFTAV
jgi:hypothetical protein